MRKRIEEEKERQKWERIMYVREFSRQRQKTPEGKAAARFRRQAHKIELEMLREENKELREQVQTLRYMIENAMYDIDKLELRLRE